MEQYNKPGSIQIDEIILTNYNGSRKTNITPIVMEFNIYESMNKPFVTASFVIHDAVALVTQFPIIGQEVIQIKFKTPGNAFLKPIEHAFRVIGIQEYKRENIRETTYMLNCVSPPMIKDMNTRIRKAYVDRPISEMVQTIVKDYLGAECEANDPTEGTRTYVVPNISPSDACLWLTRNAKSQNYMSNAYFFFQSLDGFRFVTSDQIIDPVVRTKGSQNGRSIDKYYGMDFEFSRGGTPRSSATGGSGGASQLSSKPYEYLKLKSFVFHNMGNYYAGMRMGYVENKINFIDPATSFYEEKVYKYNENDNVFKKTSENRAAAFLTDSNDYIKSGDSFTLIEPTNHTQQNTYQPDQSFEILQNKIGSKFIFENVNATITIPGDSEKRCGQVVDLQFPEYGGTDKVEQEINKFISGEYLVLSVRHIYNSNGYDTVMNVSKNAYEQPIEQTGMGNSTSIASENKAATGADVEAKDTLKRIPTRSVQ
jgi:hypothetical protein